MAAIQINNKPDFLYCEEAFAVLVVNGWELVLKAKWLADHGNGVSLLCVMEPRMKSRSGWWWIWLRKDSLTKRRLKRLGM